MAKSPKYHVRGTSVDGAVWAIGDGCWTSYKPEAENVLAEQMKRNQTTDADACIGRLRLVGIET